MRFLTPTTARSIASAFETPCFVYDAATLKQQALAALAFPNAYGLTVRYAMKAAPNAAILKLFQQLGLHIDASSGYEAWRALRAGIPGEKISLSAQQFPADFTELYEQGVKLNACSLRQLKDFGRLYPGHACGVRFNPGTGSGGNGKTNVGGPQSSFGIWHEWADEVQAIARQHRLQIERIHTHIGSGSDPAVWSEVAHVSLKLVERFTEATTLNLGGGYKVARMPDEVSTDLQTIGLPVKKAFEQLFEKTGRQIHLEIEPGTFLVANAGCLISSIIDVVSTGGPQATVFYKVDSGMTEILRPSLYGSQHPIHVLPLADQASEQLAMVVGHNCESGDILTCASGDAEKLAPRNFPVAEPGDLCVIEGAGAYCASMSAKNYNSFPEAAEVWLDEASKAHLIRERQTLEHMLQNERPLPDGSPS
jgi:diaminopimelate decarboxylase